MVAELNANGVVISRFDRDLNGRLMRSSRHGWYLFNARGDVVQLTNAAGAVIRTYRYDAFGNEIGTTKNGGHGSTGSVSTNPFRFAGMYWDAHTQTYMTPNRHLNPRTGRWTQPDPFWNISNMQFGSNPAMRNNRAMPNSWAIMQSANLFVFVMNNPVRFIDPLGLWSKDTHASMTRTAMERIINERGMADVFNSHLSFIIAGNLLMDSPEYAAFDNTIAFDFNNNPGRHFNRATDGTDSRIMWGEHYLALAIGTWTNAEYAFGRGWINSNDRYTMRINALTYLGRGLHSIQDIEAHGNIGVGRPFAVHAPGNLGADNVNREWNRDRTSTVMSRSGEQIRYNISINDSENYLNRFYSAIGFW